MAQAAVEIPVGDDRPRVLVTGATGFVGSALCAALEQGGVAYRRALRSGASAHAEDAVVGKIGPDTDWRAALENVTVVVHLAARTHVMRESAADPLAAYREVNVEGTRRLAEAAAAAGVRRFVFLSSIKVNGERTDLLPFGETDAPHPEDAYGITKLEAERVLGRIAVESDMGMGVTILRPPLVYGPGVKSNFLALMRAVRKGVPLPLGSVDNRRSLVYVGNLVSAIVACLNNHRAAGQTFLVSDGEDLSTPALIRRLGSGLGTRPRVYPFPVSLLRFAGALTGKRAQVARLTDSLQVDSARIRQTLGWTPPVTVEQGLLETARWFASRTDVK
ncbi:MAG TPA: SDR family oxidoreductase [Burkholderiales bacterium]|nr:SDR family oxidoreductase [Burkholderiales bacterium]